MTLQELEQHGAELAHSFHEGVNAGMEAGSELMNNLVRKAIMECIESLPEGTFARREMEKLHGRIEMLTIYPEDIVEY